MLYLLKLPSAVHVYILGNGGSSYILPETSNFPVVDSLFFSSRDTRLSLQMKAGQSKLLSGKEANTIYSTAGGCLMFVVPDESIIRRKVAYSGAVDGPEQWRHYRFVLKKLLHYWQ